MSDNQSNDLEQVSEELADLEKEFATKPSDPYPHEYYTGDTSIVSNAVPGNDKNKISPYLLIDKEKFRAYKLKHCIFPEPKYIS
ncbi:hypothetical protein F3K44_08960 [Bacillus megaterium]|nr:hypothetical protein [Priestia megaterium]